MKENIDLEIAESLQEDIDKGVARVSSKIMKDLSLVSGDIIEIKNKSTTAVKVLRGISTDSDR